MSNNNVDKMQTAKGRLALFAGFWIALAAKMKWEACDWIPIAGTDGRNVWYNKEQLNSRPMGEVVFIALHEIGHPMLRHIGRQGNRDRDLVGIATDIVLNDLLAKVAAETPVLQMVMPSDACTSTAFNVPTGLTWEATYELLLKQCKGKPGNKDGKGTLTLKGQGLGKFDDHLEPKDADGNPLTEDAKDALAKEWQHAVQSAAVMAKQRGKLPGFLEEFIGELIRPKVDWRTQLAHCMARVTHDESSYRRFNRRHLSRGHYLPGQYNERIGSIAYFCDTSGSISSEEFRAAKGAMTDILEELKPETIHFGQCDTQLHDVVELKPDDLPLPELRVCGRGGTDMREAFEWACQHEHEIEAFILQTDLYIPPLAADLIPNVPVIWIVTTDAPVPAGCDFGSMVRVVL